MVLLVGLKVNAVAMLHSISSSVYVRGKCTDELCAEEHSISLSAYVQGKSPRRHCVEGDDAINTVTTAMPIAKAVTRRVFPRLDIVVSAISKVEFMQKDNANETH